MLPYAETFLSQAAANQWFIRFYVESNDLTHEHVKQTQLSWFVSQGLQLTEVRTQEYDVANTNFYHVNFASDADVRLKAYSDQFENEQGVSLQPELYQLYEWSYPAWCESGLQQAWQQHVEKTV